MKLNSNGYATDLTGEAFAYNIGKARKAELLVAAMIPQVYPDLDWVKHVGQNDLYYHVGDIIAQDCWNDTVSFEVKDDGSIHRTGNAFLEHTKFDKDGNGTIVGGYMQLEHADYLVIHSTKAQHCWALDMPALQKDGFYQTGRYVNNAANSMTNSAGYLHSIAALRRDGYLLGEWDYDLDDAGYPHAHNIVFYA